MMIQVMVIADDLQFIGRIDMDSDLFTDFEVCDKLSMRIIPDNGDKEFWVTDLFDLFSNYEKVQITKI